MNGDIALKLTCGNVDDYMGRKYQALTQNKNGNTLETLRFNFSHSFYNRQYFEENKIMLTVTFT